MRILSLHSVAPLYSASLHLLSISSSPPLDKKIPSSQPSSLHVLRVNRAVLPPLPLTIPPRQRPGDPGNGPVGPVPAAQERDRTQQDRETRRRERAGRQGRSRDGGPLQQQVQEPDAPGRRVTSSTYRDPRTPTVPALKRPGWSEGWSRRPGAWPGLLAGLGLIAVVGGGGGSLRGLGPERREREDAHPDHGVAEEQLRRPHGGFHDSRRLVAGC
ncbi:hypothetical protein DL765_006174 [Monosporascus sp. GIB2]|nr:hypothetical protein DL765_006174 [Monosporascus sp. GIB2]